MEPLQSTLLAHLGQVPDFRKARGQRFAWAYLLALVAAAVAAGQTTVLTMSAWAEQHAAELIATLQPACPRIPSAATWRRLVVHIDIAALEAAGGGPQPGFGCRRCDDWQRRHA